MGKKEKVQYTKHLKLSEVLIYSFGLFGLQMIIFYLNSYQVEFYGSSGMVALKDMVYIPFIILGARIISALFDPLIGNMIDQKKSKGMGKLKPFILYSLAPLLLFTIIIFVKIPLKGAAMYFWIFFTTTCWSIAMTLADIPSQAMSAVLTPDSTERTNLIGLSGTLRSIGQAAPYVVVPLVCVIVPKGAGLADGSISYAEYLTSAVTIGILGCLLLLLIVFRNKERVPYVAEKTTFKMMFQTVKGNKYLMLVMLSFFLGFARQGAMAIQLQTANAILGSGNKIIILGISTAVGTMISMAITPLLIKVLDERKVFVGMSIYGFIASVLAFIVCKFTNYHLAGLIIVLFLIGLQFGAVNIMPMIMVADSVDYYEHKTGKRTEGIAYAILSFCIKVTLALGAAVCLAVVFSKAVGYDPNQAATTISKKTKDGVFFAYTVIPGITSLLAAIPIFFYDLNKNKKKEISEELNRRRSEDAKNTESLELEDSTNSQIIEENHSLADSQNNESAVDSNGSLSDATDGQSEDKNND